MVISTLISFCMLIICGLIIYFLNKKSSEPQKWILIMLGCSYICLLSYFIESKSRELLIQEYCFTISYIFKGLTLMTFLQFISNYCHIRIPKWINQLILCFLCCMAIIMMSNHSTHLVYDSATIGGIAGVYYLKYSINVMYYVFIYGLTAMMFGCDVMIYFGFISKKGIERTILGYLFIVGFTPCVGYVIEKFILKNNIDLVVIGFTGSALILLLLTRRYGLLDMIQIAQKSIWENTKDGLLIVDPDYNLRYANQALIEVYPEIYEKAGAEAKDEIKALFLNPESVTKNDDKYYEVRVSKLYENKALKGYMAWIFDMTFINNYTNEILHLKDEAEKANVAKASFLANMSHEIRTPMNAILGFSELLLRSKISEETKGYVKDIKRSAKNLLDIINDILDFSKIEAGKMELHLENYYVQSLFGDVSIVIAGLAREKGLIFDYTVDKTIPYQLRGAVGPIREILTNILNNSVKYTSEGYVRFHVENRGIEGDRIDLAFIISDTGMGIKEDDLKIIFEKFSQFDSKANRSIEGTGLGMAIVKAYLDQMNAKIEIESEYGKYTKATVLLSQEIVNSRSIGEVPEELLEEEETEENRQFILNANILVVDDNETNLRVATGFLRKYGVEADTAEDGYQAIDKVIANEYDIIFMDHMMPKMDGVETMKRIKSMLDGQYSNIPIIALTANAISGVREEMIEQGFQGYISKPIDVPKLEYVLLKFISDDKIVYVEEAPSLQIVEDEEKDDLSFVLKDMDITAGSKNCGGSVEDYMQILEVVYKHGTQRVERLQNMMAQKDYENYTIDVHALKSTAANIGAMELSEMAYEQEMAGKAKNYDFLEAHYEELIAYYQQILEEISKALEMEGEQKLVIPPEEEDKILSFEEDEKQEITGDEVVSLLKTIAELLDDFEMTKAEEVLLEMTKFVLPEEIEKSIQDSIKTLQSLDLAKTKDIVKNTLNMLTSE